MRSRSRLIVAPTVVVWLAGAVIVGAALTVQVNALDGTLTLAASVMVTMTLLYVCARRRRCR